MNPHAARAARIVTCLALTAIAAACDRSDPLAPRTSAAAPVALRYQVDGMHCQGCVDAITDKLKHVDGVVDCRVKLEDRQADVAVRDASMAPAVQQAIEKLGYKVKPLG